MTENDEKLAKRLAEEYRGQDHNSTGHCKMRGFYNGFLAGIEHERARSKNLVMWANRVIKGPDRIHLVYPGCNCDACNPTQGLINAIKEYESGAE